VCGSLKWFPAVNPYEMQGERAAKLKERVEAGLARVTSKSEVLLHQDPPAVRRFLK